MTGSRLVLMAKEPVAGLVKTRLVPVLGAAGAARLYGAFLHDFAERVAGLEGVERVLAVWPTTLAASWLDPFRGAFRCVAQRGDSLAARMASVARQAFDDGVEGLLIVGTDLPILPLGYLTQAFDALRKGVQVVLGPDPDGGYYALGLSMWVPEIFEIPMSTGEVLAGTLAILEARGARVELLPSFADVDLPGDLTRLRAELRDPRIAALAPRTARVLRELVTTDP